jgi:hypothetical protein
MSLRNLRILALLILALSIASYGQSLGDVARQARADQQRKGGTHARVITNDDLVRETDATPPENDSKGENKDVVGSATQSASSTGDSKKGAASEIDEPKTGKDGDQARKKPVNEREERELETEKRSQAINHVYVDRIVNLRKKIDNAQIELAKLQQAQADNNFQFRRTAGLSPYPSEYAAQQNEFNEKIEAQRTLINTLNAQLEDAHEAARHAGVPRAYDY